MALTQKDGTVDDERKRGRGLYIGMVDVDSGRAVGVDLTELASEFTKARASGDDAKAKLVHDCYVRAIIASSSVPLAALPIFIDNRMYIDGGARFGLFTGEHERVIRELANTGVVSASGSKPIIYALVNGSLTTSARCRTNKEPPGPHETSPCPDETEFDGRHIDWNIVGLAERSSGILVNQIYRFSTERLKDIADENGFELKVEYIRPDGLQHPFEMDEPGLGSGTKSCIRWKIEDWNKDKPLEFHPRYMRCILAYGRVRANLSGWSTAE